MAMVSLSLLEEKYADKRKHNPHLDNLFTRPELDLKFFQEDLSELEEENKLTGFRDIHLDILEAQRAQLTAMNHKAEFDEELIRKYLSLVDIEEFKVREKIKACK